MRPIRALIHWPRRATPFSRRLVLIVIDNLLILPSIWLSFWLRLSNPFSPELIECLWLFPTTLLFASPVYAFTGQYKSLTKYAGSQAFYRIACRNALLIAIVSFVGITFRFASPPRSSWFLLWLLITAIEGSIRVVLRDLMVNFPQEPLGKVTRIAIYGAGSDGVQLASALRLVGNYLIEAFLDDDSSLWGRDINGVKIYPPKQLNEIPSSLDQILIAIPSLSKSRCRNIVESLAEFNIPVLQIPGIEEITSGKVRIDSLKPIAIQELLGRDEMSPDPNLLGPGIRHKSILVTGAGGSIGSELCRQILRYQPKRLVLFERSEPSLYQLNEELRKDIPLGVELELVLGSACDQHLVRRILRDYQVDVVYHAAAYKHVPLVEQNPLSGIKNNVLGTLIMAKESIDIGVNSFMLISTDKAVRPTNVMGASKRIAELVVQSLAKENQEKIALKNSTNRTRLSMVRFGNVLGSSGSVVPLFCNQINSGGPITITHPEIIRYFMTIPEAAQLVLQAETLAKGGDLFLLDMGEQVLILDLAKQMIRLSGLTLRDSNNPSGDIEIVYTGLRPGEKLYEELLIDAESEVTSHPLIFKAREKEVNAEEFWNNLELMMSGMKDQNIEATLKSVATLVPEWNRSF